MLAQFFEHFPMYIISSITMKPDRCSVSTAPVVNQSGCNSGSCYVGKCNKLRPVRKMIDYYQYITVPPNCLWKEGAGNIIADQFETTSCLNGLQRCFHITSTWRVEFDAFPTVVDIVRYIWQSTKPEICFWISDVSFRTQNVQTLDGRDKLLIWYYVGLAAQYICFSILKHRP